MSNENKVELIGYYGGDETHALSAWTSTSRDLTDEKRSRIGNLLNMLARENHGTPYEKSAIHFLVTTDIASHVHLIKHRAGVSLNGESARYKELKEDKIYLPSDWNEKWLSILKAQSDMTNSLYHDCLEELTPILGRKRAKESARFFKMFNSQITMDITFNWRSFYHFQKLRNSEHAQVEVRELAQQMLDIVKNIENNPFKQTIEAFEL